MTDIHPKANDILSYWFGENYATASSTFFPQEKTKVWFMGGPAVDKEITERYAGDLKTIGEGGYDDWQNDPWNCLAGVVLMDQFSRNIHRNAHAYDLDPIAIKWALHALDTGLAGKVSPIQRTFFYLPLMHSESLPIQERGVQLYSHEAEAAEKLAPQAEALNGFLKYCKKFAVEHRDIIAKWGRFPHRNAMLGRESTPEEVKGLEDKTIASF